MKDRSVPDEELFSSKLKMKIGECEIVLGFGGIHGAISGFMRGVGIEDS